eukprot:12833-Eustigmatos_ZCMA.PRE.1
MNQRRPCSGQISQSHVEIDHTHSLPRYLYNPGAIAISTTASVTSAVPCPPKFSNEASVSTP